MFGAFGVCLIVIKFCTLKSSRNLHEIIRFGKVEAENLDLACMPLYEAEIDRDELRSLKHLIECE